MSLQPPENLDDGEVVYWKELVNRVHAAVEATDTPDEPTMEQVEVLAQNIPGVDDPHTGFQKLPPGWDRSTVMEVWTKVGGSFTSCKTKFTTEEGWSPRKADRFCAALKDEVRQSEDWREGGGQAPGKGPFSMIPGVPNDPDRITRSMLEDMVRWKMNTLVERATMGASLPPLEATLNGTVEFGADWNPSLHPRDPETGQFIERPWDIDMGLEDIDSTPTHKLARFMAETAGEPDMDAILSDDSIRIDGIPDDIDTGDELRARLDNPQRDADIPTNPKSYENITDGDIIRTPDGPREVINKSETGEVLEVRKPDGGRSTFDVGTYRRNTVDVYDKSNLHDMPSVKNETGDIPDLPSGTRGHGVVPQTVIDPGFTEDKVDAFRDAVDDGRIKLGSTPLSHDGPLGIDKGVAALSVDLLEARDNPTNNVNLGSYGSYQNAQPYVALENPDRDFLEGAKDRINPTLPDGYRARVTDDAAIRIKKTRGDSLPKLRGKLYDDATEKYPDIPSDDAIEKYANEVDIVDEYGFPTNERRAELDSALMRGLRDEMEGRDDDTGISLDDMDVDDFVDSNPDFVDDKHGADEGDFVRVDPKGLADRDEPFVGRVTDRRFEGAEYTVETADGDELDVGAGEPRRVDGYIPTDAFTDDGADGGDGDGGGTPAVDLSSLSMDHPDWKSAIDVNGKSVGDVVQVKQGEFDYLGARRQADYIKGRITGQNDDGFEVEFADGTTETHPSGENHRWGQVFDPPGTESGTPRKTWTTYDTADPENARWETDNIGTEDGDVVRVNTERSSGYEVARVEDSGFNKDTVVLPDGERRQMGDEADADSGVVGFEGVYTKEAVVDPEQLPSADDRETLDLTELDGDAADRRQAVSGEFKGEIPQEAVEEKDIPEGTVIAKDRSGGSTFTYQVTGYENTVTGTEIEIESESGKTRTISPRIANERYKFYDPGPEASVTIPESDWGDDDTPLAQRKRNIKSIMDDVVTTPDNDPRGTDDGELGDEYFENAKDEVARHLARAHDKEHAETVIAKLTSIGERGRAHAGISQNVWGETTSYFAVPEDKREKRIIHELGHSVGQIYGYRGGSNDMDKQTYPMPDFAWQSPKYDVTDKYGLKPRPGHEDYDPTKSVHDQNMLGEDRWRDEVDEQVGTGLSAQNFTPTDDPETLQEGRMLRLEDGEPGLHEPRNWNIVERDGDRITIEDSDGFQTSGTVEKHVTDLQIRWDDDSPYNFVSKVYGKRNSQVDNWNGNPPDPDDHLGEQEFNNTREAMDHLAEMVSKAWYRQAAATREHYDGDSQAGREIQTKYAIKDGYSAKQAHETWSRIHEVMRPGSEQSPGQHAENAYTLVKYHPDLLEAYRNVYDIPNTQAKAINAVLEQEGADYRIDDVVDIDMPGDVKSVAEVVREKYNEGDFQ